MLEKGFEAITKAAKPVMEATIKRSRKSANVLYKQRQLVRTYTPDVLVI
jgi:hypothetical protein